MNESEILSMIHTPEGRNRAFDHILDHYQKKIYYHVRHMVIDHDDAHDITQDTFIKVWKGLDGFKAQSALYTWIYRIATNECLSFLKKKRTRYMLPLHDVEGELAQKVDTQALMEADEVEKLFQKAILSLPQKQRLVFNMKYYQDLTYEEISTILDTSVGALKASYHHATKKIEHYILNH